MSVYSHRRTLAWGKCSCRGDLQKCKRQLESQLQPKVHGNLLQSRGPPDISLGSEYPKPSTYVAFAAELCKLANSPKEPRVLRAALVPELTSPFSQADASNVSLEKPRSVFC